VIKVLVTGDRNWTAESTRLTLTGADEGDSKITAENNIWLSRRQTVREAIEHLELDFNTPLSQITIIHGGARGADSLAGDLAAELGCKVRVYHASWQVYGKGAGPIRNRQMVDENPDIVHCLAFHDDLEGRSRGTLHMARYAKQNGISVNVYRSDGSYYVFMKARTGLQFGRGR